jgi:hypothetical protein
MAVFHHHSRRCRPAAFQRQPGGTQSRRRRARRPRARKVPVPISGRGPGATPPSRVNGRPARATPGTGRRRECQ